MQAEQTVCPGPKKRPHMSFCDKIRLLNHLVDNKKYVKLSNIPLSQLSE